MTVISWLVFLNYSPLTDRTTKLQKMDDIMKTSIGQVSSEQFRTRSPGIRTQPFGTRYTIHLYSVLNIVSINMGRTSAARSLDNNTTWYSILINR